MHKKIINKIQKNGFAVIENVFTHKECNAGIKQIENVFKTRLQQNKGVGNKNVQVIFNYKVLYLSVAACPLASLLDDTSGISL